MWWSSKARCYASAMDSKAFDLGIAIGEALPYVLMGIAALIVVVLIFLAPYFADRRGETGGLASPVQWKGPPEGAEPLRPAVPATPRRASLPGARRRPPRSSDEVVLLLRARTGASDVVVGNLA